MDNDFKAAMARVRENEDKLKMCPQHKFDPAQWEKDKLGQSMVCLNCGGKMKVVPNISEYIAGYEAAGKSADDIWTGFRHGR